MIAEEVRRGAPPVEHLARGRIEIGGGRTGLGRQRARLVHLRHDPPGLRISAICGLDFVRTIYVQMRSSTTFDQALEHLVAVADAVDLGEHAAARGSTR